MRKIVLFCSLLFLLTPCWATNKLAKQGVYIGMQAGWVNSHDHRLNNTWTDAVIPVWSKDASRVFAGFRFDDHFAVEGGYTSIIKRNNIQLTSFDISGKLITPLSHDFSAYIKAGMARTKQEFLVNNNQTIRYLPVVGLGFGYNLTKYLNFDISWSYGRLSANPNITWKIVQKNFDKSWNIHLLSMNPNITWKIIERRHDISWNYSLLSRNPMSLWEKKMC